MAPLIFPETSEFLALTEESGCPAGSRRHRFNDLRGVAPVITTHRESVFARLERPVIAPEHPRHLRQGSSDLSRLPRAVINPHFDLRDPAGARMGNPANGHQFPLISADDGHIDGDGVYHGGC